MFRPPPRPTLFPYTTLFRSCRKSRKKSPGSYVISLPAASAALCCFTSARTRIYPALCSDGPRSEEHTSELQSRFDLVCRLLLEKKKKISITYTDVSKKQRKD